MIDVVYDAEGARLALEEIFEIDYVRARVERQSAGASAETRERMRWQIPQRALSPGYYRFAEHLLMLDEQRRAGVGFYARELAWFEAKGLVALERARGEFERNHPPCSACGTRQENRFSMECCGCGVKFRSAKGK